MNAKCINDDESFKACPYRVITEEYKAFTVGTGDTVVQEFYPCMGEGCAAYHAGVCLRLQEALNSLPDVEVRHEQ